MLSHNGRSNDILMQQIPEGHGISHASSLSPATQHSSITSPPLHGHGQYFRHEPTHSWLNEEPEPIPQASPPRRHVSTVSKMSATSRRSSRRSSLAILEEMQELRETVAFLTQRLREVEEHNESNQLYHHTRGHSNSSTPNDPGSKEFDMLQWLQVFTRNFNDQGYKSLRTGVAFRNLTVTGSGEAVQLQDTVLDAFFRQPIAKIASLLTSSDGRSNPPKKILHGFNGLVREGELLLVLGRPGSGCSTLLKSLCGELHGLQVADKSVVHYKGIPQRDMVEEFRGEMTYNHEVDRHFPHLTVGQTLEFAASCRIPPNVDQGMSEKEYACHVVDVVMAVCGLSHTRNTKVGNEFIRGVSGGERKRVSIAEMILAGSSLSAWDNSTRGLDSATALKFVQNLRLASDLGANTNAVAIYQASQAIYDEFDKVTLLYEGRQIYFGPADGAKEFFERQGWFCPQRQTTSDFLTSVTNPGERRPRPGMENQVPRTAREFQQYWRNSPEFAALQQDIAQYEDESRAADGDFGKAMAQRRQAKMTRQNKHVKPKSPYTISLAKQLRLTTQRAYVRKWQDMAATVSACVMNIMGALIVGSVFYGGDNDTTSNLAAKGGALFLVVLIHALSAVNEINTLYEQRPIVNKHASFAFYRPVTEAMAGIVSDMPIQFLLCVIHNIIFYFMAGLRREPGPFFVYFLVILLVTFVMSAVFRTAAAVSRTISQAMSLAGVAVLALVMYTGYVVAVPQMKPWFGWIRWISPIYYAFEILIANEFHNREYTCPIVVPSGPSYGSAAAGGFICPTVGAVAGSLTVNGDAYIAASYGYYYEHVWRNLGILLGMLVFFMILYFAASGSGLSMSSAAEVLVFRRDAVPAHLQNRKRRTIFDNINESMISMLPPQPHYPSDSAVVLEPQTDIFLWKNVAYDVNVKGETRRLLDNVSGWVKPGTLTALMGVSGAGKTTLLDVLAQRTTVGVITGDMLVNGQPLGASFQRKAGYVQQQDVHLETATVRESLRFSAMLRQPKHVPTGEKYAFVEDVIRMLNMEEFADAVIGVPGQGLNIEQRKLLTIGVELAAKPKLLLFLDEPTSGLDSQSSWTICAFLRKLANSNQAVLCTVHQPSALLFQQFDRLLFLARGGKTVYFGDIGPNSQTLIDYFEAHGARPCDPQENPAEYMLDVVNTENGNDWHGVWSSSMEIAAVNAEIDLIQRGQPLHQAHGYYPQYDQQYPEQAYHYPDSHHLQEQLERRPQGMHQYRPLQTSQQPTAPETEFATSFSTQITLVTHRIFQQYNRLPTYIFSKWLLLVVAGLFIGFTFYSPPDSLAGMNNVLFSLFMITTLFTSLVQQIQPIFLLHRSLYEVRERPSRLYSWPVFLLSNTAVEIPYQILGAVIIFATVYYPVTASAIADPYRQGMVLLYLVQFFIYIGTFAHMTIAVVPNTETAGAVVTLLVMMSLIFCGVLQSPDLLPRFWVWMYRVSPFTYWIGGMVALLLHGRAVECSEAETSVFDPPAAGGGGGGGGGTTTCGEYMADFLAEPGVLGRLQNPEDVAACRYCAYTVADDFMSGLGLSWNDRWRNFGIMWGFIAFNVFVTVLLYYTMRVRKAKRS